MTARLIRRKNSTPSLTQRQAIALLKAIPTGTLQGIRELAIMSAFPSPGAWSRRWWGRVCGNLESNGVEHYLHVTEKVRLCG